MFELLKTNDEINLVGYFTMNSNTVTNFLFFISLVFYHLTNHSVFLGKNIFLGKKLLCVNSNPNYLVEGAKCSIKLMNRTHQQYNISYKLHSNVTINQFYVSNRYICYSLTTNLSNYYYKLNQLFVQARLVTYHKFYTVYRQIMVNVEVDMCDYYKDPESHVNLDKILMAQNSSLHSGCPYRVCDF